MDYINAVILAVVEGVTEFLPVSSTGHLILAESWLGFGDDDTFIKSFIVIIQLPAILSVCVYFWSTLWPVKGGEAGSENLDSVDEGDYRLSSRRSLGPSLGQLY